MKLAQTTLSRRDSLKIARRFNAGNRFVSAASPAGTAENARPFRSSLPPALRSDATSRDLNSFAALPGVKTPGYSRSSLWDAAQILSRLKACRKLAGGKAAGRRPRCASSSVTALKGRRNRASGFSSAPSGRTNLRDVFPGYRSAQPRANFHQPFRLVSTAHVARAEHS
jgi:hypothetical protein